MIPTSFSFSKLCCVNMLRFVAFWDVNCNFSSNSSKAKFFFNPQTPESPISVGCLSNGQRIDVPWISNLVKHWWQTVWPHINSRGTLSPWKRKTSSQTRHSRIVWNKRIYMFIIYNEIRTIQPWNKGWWNCWSSLF